jgi:hypothetical protein
MTEQELQAAIARTETDRKLRAEITAAETAMIEAEKALKIARKNHAEQVANLELEKMPKGDSA